MFFLGVLYFFKNGVIMKDKLTGKVIPMKRMLFIMNPFAGMRKAVKLLPEIITIFNRSGYLVEVYMTDGVGDGEEKVFSLAAKADIVVCCGGDGTFHEVVSAIVKSGVNVPIGYIPAGSTNDFANSLKLPLQILQAAKAIAGGKPQPYDLGRFGDQYFSYVASFGAFTKSSYATPQNMKNAIGHAAYLLSGIQEISQIHAIPVKVDVDGVNYDDSYVFGAVCNCTSMGGVLTLDPERVDMSDGLFEIMLIRAPKDLSELGECLLALQRKDYNCKMITFLSGKKIRIEMEQPLCWSLDGEKAQSQKVVQIENLHHAYRLMKGD